MMRLSSTVETSNLQFVSGTALLPIQGFYPACIIFHFPPFWAFQGGCGWEGGGSDYSYIRVIADWFYMLIHLLSYTRREIVEVVYYFLIPVVAPSELLQVLL